MDNDRTPLGVVIAAANEHEVRHIERLLDAAVVELPQPARLLYDGAADSDPLRDRLEKRGVELVCPHRANRVKPKRQDDRAAFGLVSVRPDVDLTDGELLDTGADPRWANRVLPAAVLTPDGWQD